MEADFGKAITPGGCLGAGNVKTLARQGYLVPGLVLLAVNGVGSLVGAWTSFGWRRFAGVLGTGLGVFLMVWTLVQVWWIGFGWRHLLYFVLGLVEAGLGVAWARGARRPQATGWVRSG